MATGIQTGLRTGSRTGMTTGGRGAPTGKQPGGGPLGKVKEIWGGLGKGIKIALMACLGLGLTGVLVFSVYSKNNQPVALFTTKMAAQDVNDCAAELTKLGIAHSVAVTGDVITISDPHARSKALIALAAAGLPRHAVVTAMTANDSTMGKTAAEQKMARQHQLEGDLTETLRQIDGVADAYVHLATPEDVFFRDDAKPSTASVTLKLTPGTTLTEKQILGMVHLVAYSVPDLDKKNVKISDTTGTDLTADINQDDEAGLSSGKMSVLENAKAKELTQKAQSELDTILGPNKAKVAVNCEMDFAQYETKSHNVGGAGDNGSIVVNKTKLIEHYNKGQKGASEAGGTPVSDDEGSPVSLPADAAKDGSGYVNEKEHTTTAISTVDTTKVLKAPEIKRLTASVAVDGLKQDEADKIAGLVKATIGFDDSRGDVVTVDSIHFHHAMIDQNAPAAFAATPSQSGDHSSGVAQMMAMAMFAVALPMLGLIGLFVLKQHRVQVGKAQLMLDTTNGNTSTDIADLLTDKSGRTTATNMDTKVNTSDALEKLAKEKPTKVAEMLKSTWLSG